MIDIKRVVNPIGQLASFLNTSKVSAIIDDYSSMLSSCVFNDGKKTLILRPTFSNYRERDFNQDNKDFWQNNELLNKMGISYFSIPNYKGLEYCEDNIYDSYRVIRYGTDPITKGVWTLNTASNKAYRIRKIDFIIPDQSVLYTAVTFENLLDIDIEIVYSLDTYLGSSILENNSFIQSNSYDYYAHSNSNSRLAENKGFLDLKKGPLKDGSFVDLTLFKTDEGYNDYISGAVNKENEISYNALVNPNTKSIFLQYATSCNGILDEEDIVFNYHNFDINSAGKDYPPFSYARESRDQSNFINMGFSSSYANKGLNASINQKTFLDKDTTLRIKPKSFHRISYASAFTSYDNPRFSMGFYTITPVAEGLVIKRTKSWMLLECDSTFYFLKTLEKRLR